MYHFELYIALILIKHDITILVQDKDGHIDLLPRREFKILLRFMIFLQLIHIQSTSHIEWMNSRVLLADVEELLCSVFSINAIFNSDGDWVRRDGFILD